MSLEQNKIECASTTRGETRRIERACMSQRGEGRNIERADNSERRGVMPDHIPEAATEERKTTPRKSMIVKFDRHTRRQIFPPLDQNSQN